MDDGAIKRAYQRYAGVYDLIFGAVFNPGRKLTVGRANTRPGQRILEIGVGTGLSLPYYRADSRVVGIDLSSDMLAVARSRVTRDGLAHVESLLEMNAEALEFEDASFDAVVAMYVISVASNPLAVIREMQRVCKPGGTLLFVNHFTSGHPLLRRIEKGLAGFSKALGFRPNLDLESVVGVSGLDVVSVRKANLFGYWTLVEARNSFRSFVSLDTAETAGSQGASAADGGRVASPGD